MITRDSKRRRRLILCFAVLTQIGVAEGAVAAPLSAMIQEFATAGESFRLRSPERQVTLLEAAAEASRVELAAVPLVGLKGSEAGLAQIVRLAQELEKTGEPNACVLALALRHAVDFAVLFEMVRADAVAAGKAVKGPQVNGTAGPEVVERVLRVSEIPGQKVLAFVMKSPSSCARVLRKAGVSAKDLSEKGAELLPREARDSAEKGFRCGYEANEEGESDQTLLYDWLFWAALGSLDKARDVRTVARVYAEGGWEGDYFVLKKRITEMLGETPRLRLSTAWPDSYLQVLSGYGRVEHGGPADYERNVAVVLRKALRGRELLESARLLREASKVRP